MASTCFCGSARIGSLQSQDRLGLDGSDISGLRCHVNAVGVMAPHLSQAKEYRRDASAEDASRLGTPA